MSLPSHNAGWRRCLLLVMGGVLLPPGHGRAQPAPSPGPDDLGRAPVLGRDLLSAFWRDQPAPEAPGCRAPRFRMFRMLPGFMNDPLGLEGGTEPAVGADPAAGAAAGRGDDSGAGGLQILFGEDNPYFDLRRPGDPGGVGFIRVHSQLQLLDAGGTSLCLNLQAFAPAGAESGGLQTGPTVLTPALALFQELGGGTALQGFVGQNIWAQRAPADAPGQALQYGMGLQYALPGLGADREQGVYLFLQALGSYQYDGDRAHGRAGSWEFVPGVHWRVNEKCWLSLGAARMSLLTCSWQF